MVAPLTYVACSAVLVVSVVGVIGYLKWTRAGTGVRIVPGVPLFFAGMAVPSGVGLLAPVVGGLRAHPSVGGWYFLRAGTQPVDTPLARSPAHHRIESVRCGTRPPWWLSGRLLSPMTVVIRRFWPRFVVRCETVSVELLPLISGRAAPAG